MLENPYNVVYVIFDVLFFFQCLCMPNIKGLLHCFSTCIEIIGNNWYCFILKKGVVGWCDGAG